ncbi:MAG: ATP-binding protein, partial [Firmicutes bacterium]|nr:ATP-binding protein [Bacillota bacterium]
MQVYALIGPSGTGKSHRASYLAFKYEIPLIVDDGLLIAGASVLAGKSAKREATRFAAVKRAIFHDDKHAN